MRNWKAGRKKRTPEQAAAYKEWANVRMKISNLVARKPEIQKECCICGKEGKILHNREDPYYISFICEECRKDKSNLTIAIESRIDIRSLLDKEHLRPRIFTDEEVKRIIVGYQNTLLSIEDYCSELDITRYIFNKLIDRYDKMFPRQKIRQCIKEHSNKVQKDNLNKK